MPITEQREELEIKKVPQTEDSNSLQEENINEKEEI